MGSDTLVHNAIEQMAEISAGTALVIDNNALVGIFSERDVIRKVILQGNSIDDVPVKEIMSTELTTVSPEESLEQCMQLMTDKRIRHLPVLQNGEIVGIVSIGDVVKYLIVEKDFKIKNLETYITGAM
ncbi:MAG: CBS domain-containing protein [Kiritimatiellales bacterium]|nr:CBS domain-containing protein [Kiritimatiellales bacterium]